MYQRQDHIIPHLLNNLFLIISVIFATSLLEKENTINDKWSIKMAKSEMKRNPDAITLDFVKHPKWNYTHGLVLTAFSKLWYQYNDSSYFRYIQEYYDFFVNDSGEIKNYNLKDYNIDKINPGRGLLFLYKQTNEEKYKKAALFLHKQLKTHPRTSEGNFWHKKRYPWQVWLDGIYMGLPFYAEFGIMFDDSTCFDDISKQIILVDNHLKDPQTGLYFHGWDESRDQRWADSKTGLSPHIWGRGVGWFAMALVDVLDFLPKHHNKRSDIIAILNSLAVAIKKSQDEETGLWYQVMDKPDGEGNYLESTASTMFVYTLIKAVKKNYIESKFQYTALKGFNGILKHFIITEDDGTISITKCCAGAGLGGNPYRDGSYEYYISTDIRDNDPKAVGPFIMAALEFESLDN
ncbi:MAG: glycoside hydrolase family 88 protein [Calditrichaceae bacterium]